MWPAIREQLLCRPAARRAGCAMPMAPPCGWRENLILINSHSVFNTERPLFALERFRNHAVWAHRALCVLP